MKSWVLARRLALAGAVTLLQACGEAAKEGPPEVDFGNSVCVECGMILSDARFAAATFVQGPRGRTPLLFDDYNCQANYELANPGVVVLDRWCHDYASAAWIPSDAAFFVHSGRIRSPMASSLAAFEDRAAADAAAVEFAGQILPFEDYIALTKAGAMSGERVDSPHQTDNHNHVPTTPVGQEQEP
jgi:copper chaperone NosL